MLTLAHIFISFCDCLQCDRQWCGQGTEVLNAPLESNCWTSLSTCGAHFLPTALLYSFQYRPVGWLGGDLVVTGWLFQKTRRPRLSVESRGIADHCPPIDFAFVAETFADTLLCVPGHREHGWGHSPDKSGHWTQEYGELCPNLVWLKFSAVLLTIIESMNL